LLRHRPKVSEMDNDHHLDEIVNKDQGWLKLNTTTNNQNKNTLTS
jgi:hypothetical protein